MSEDIPEWATERAIELYRAEPGRHEQAWESYRKALARYIAEHEKPPVDPLEVAVKEALKECALRTLCPSDFEKGADDGPKFLAALKRGIELAKAGEA